MPKISELPRLADCLPGRDNNLNLIRMAAASAVLVSHAFPIALGKGADEPLLAWTGMTLGTHAVVLFFILSGLLIARSFDRSSSLIRFVEARALRLFPALLVVLLLTILLGAMVTTLAPADYFSDLQTVTYVPRNLSLALPQYGLPGVFAANPYPLVINGSLWTLFYEVLCYVGVLGIGLLGLLRRRLAFSFVFLLIAAGFYFSQSWEPVAGIGYRLDRLALLAFPFALGMLAYVWRDSIVLDLRIGAAIWLLPLAAAGTLWLAPAIIVAVGYTTLWLGFVPKGAILIYNRLGDYSYGVYIYAFPVQQLMAHLFPDASPLENMMLAAPVMVLLAVASWHLIEERALSLVKKPQPTALRTARPISSMKA